MLNGTPFTFGHVVVDEAQDHSAVSLRVIGRRSPHGSMTILGDLAQSTTPAGQQDWTEALGHIRATAAEVAVLTIGYRVPGPILDAANRLLPFTEVSSEPSRSVRLEGSAPVVRLVASGRVVRRRRRSRWPRCGIAITTPASLLRCVARGDRRGVGRARSAPSRSCARPRPRRRAGVHGRGGEGPRVRRRRRGQRAPDLRRLSTRRTAALRGDDPRRAGAALRRRRPAPTRVADCRYSGRED